VVNQPMSASDAWAQVSGYVAEMVTEGSKDAAQILTFMHELKPATRVFTGPVEDLRKAGSE
jgi:hypothetical protein